MTFNIKMVKSTAKLLQYYVNTGHINLLSLQAACLSSRIRLKRGIMAENPKEPFGWLNHFRQQMDEIFGYLTTLEGKEGLEREATPLVDIYETAESFVVEVELPGFDPQQISLRSCYNTLIVAGYKREESRREGLNYICLERQFGRFCRTVDVPPDVDVAGAKARYEKGLLSVVFPKLPSRKMIIREIPIE